MTLEDGTASHLRERVAGRVVEGSGVEVTCGVREGRGTHGLFAGLYPRSCTSCSTHRQYSDMSMPPPSGSSGSAPEKTSPSHVQLDSYQSMLV